MKINPEIIKKMRTELNFTQAEMAEKLFMSQRQLSRIENGQSDLDMLSFYSILEILGYRTEDFWLLYLETDEYANYRTFKELKNLASQQKFGQIQEKLQELENSPLMNYPFIQQYISMIKARIAPALSVDERIELLMDTISQTIKNFDDRKIKDYKMTFPEVSSVYELANAYSRKEDYQKAIQITGDLLENIDEMKLSQEDKNGIVPLLYLNLGYWNEFIGDYHKGLKYAQLSWAACKETGNFRFIHYSLYRIAKSTFLLGEDEAFYKPWLLRAYHTACGLGDYDVAKTMKEEALNEMGVVIEY